MHENKKCLRASTVTLRLAEGSNNQIIQNKSIKHTTTLYVRRVQGACLKCDCMSRCFAQGGGRSTCTVQHEKENKKIEKENRKYNMHNPYVSPPPPLSVTISIFPPFLQKKGHFFNARKKQKCMPLVFFSTRVLVSNSDFFLRRQNIRKIHPTLQKWRRVHSGR